MGIRPYADADLPAVARLRALRYGHPEESDLAWYAAVWRWLERHPLAGDLHRWVVTADGAVVAFLAAMPQYYRMNGERVVAHTPTDYMVHPDHGFHALTLMRTFFRTCPNCVTCDWLPAVIKVETWLGAEAVGTLHYAGRVQDVSLLPVPLPAPLRRLLNGGVRAVEAALAFGSDGGLRVERLAGFDDRFDALFDRVAAALPCLPEKDAAFLRWRYGPGSPHERSVILGATEAGELRGYAVLRVTADGRDGYILDLTASPGRRDVAAALVRHAVRYFARAGVAMVRYRFLASPAAPCARDVWRRGFVARRPQHRLFVKFADAQVQAVARDATRWAYNAGDGELSFWVR